FESRKRRQRREKSDGFHLWVVVEVTRLILNPASRASGMVKICLTQYLANPGDWGTIWGHGWAEPDSEHALGRGEVCNDSMECGNGRCFPGRTPHRLRPILAADQCPEPELALRRLVGGWKQPRRRRC